MEDHEHVYGPLIDVRQCGEPRVDFFIIFACQGVQILVGHMDRQAIQILGLTHGHPDCLNFLRGVRAECFRRDFAATERFQPFLYHGCDFGREHLLDNGADQVEKPITVDASLMYPK